MARLEWKHEWPDRSSCAQEWGRLIKEVEAHERQHAKDAEDIVKTLNANVLKRQEFRTISGETEAAALAEMERLLQQAIKDELDFAYKESGIKEEETHRKYSIKDPDYRQCKSYSFENLKYNLRIEFHFDSVGWKVVTDREVSSSGKICGNPHDETSSGYIIMHGVDRTLSAKGAEQRVPWTPEMVRQAGYMFKLDSQPPQVEWTIDPREGYGASPDIRSIPSEKFSVRVPLTVSEEPLGCEQVDTAYQGSAEQRIFNPTERSSTVVV